MPEGPGPERDQYILEAAKSGNLEYKWAHVTSSIPGHTATFAVTATAAKVDGIYPGVGAGELQRITDVLGCSLLTPKLQDLMYQQAATKIVPWLDWDQGQTFLWQGRQVAKMQSTTWFKRATVGMDNLLAKAGYNSGLAMGMGKPWQLDQRLTLHHGAAENYGLYVPASKTVVCNGRRYYGGCPPTGVYAARSETLADVYVLQDPGWAHGLDQDDYSETIWFVSRNCVVDNQLRDFCDVVRDPSIAGLASHQGALTIVRQPGVGPTDVGGVGDGCVPSLDGTTVCPIQLTGLPPIDGGSASGQAEVSSNTRALVGAGLFLGASIATALVMRKRVAQRAAQLLDRGRAA